MWLKDLFDLFVPNLCLHCSSRLRDDERGICRECALMLKDATTRLADEQLPFGGRVPVEAIYARYLYTKGGVLRTMIHRFKYKGDKHLARYLGECCAEWLQEVSRNQAFDAIVPLPLHPLKQQQRGYNQSEELARGLASKLGVGVVTGNLIRKVSTHTQTSLKRTFRWLNVKGIFEVDAPEEIEGKHLLLVDDVYTTGATLEAAAQALLDVRHVKVTIFVLAIA